jgi:hypothetical protein
MPTTMPAVNVTTSKARAAAVTGNPLIASSATATSEEHDGAGRDNQRTAHVHVPGDEEDGHACGERGTSHLLEEQRQPPPIEQTASTGWPLVDHRPGPR